MSEKMPTYIKTWNEDCISGLKTHVKDGSVDLIFTDPPYGIDGAGLDNLYGRDENKVIDGYIDVPLKEYQKFSNEWITEAARVLRPGGSIYIVSGWSNLNCVLDALQSTDLVEINHLVAPYTFGVYTKKKFVSSHYHILFWHKPPDNKRTFNTHCRYRKEKQLYADIQSVQPIERTYIKGMRHKNHLPEKFIEKFIHYSSNEGDTVLDPFGGSFSTGIAAVQNKRSFIGFELNKKAYDHFVPLLHETKQTVGALDGLLL